MENQCNPLLSWAYYCQTKSMEELRQYLLLTTLELDNVRVKAQEELKMRDDQVNQLKDLLKLTVRERDEAQGKCQKLLFEKLLLQQQQQTAAPLSGISGIEDESKRALDSNNGFSASDCEDSIVSSPQLAPPRPQSSEPPAEQQKLEVPLVADKPLPEKGKLLQAVMKAGPLLQNLLLAGPLPQWRHPPPPLETYQIPPPPVVIPSPATHLLHQDSLINITDNDCCRVNRKRGLYEVSDHISTDVKYHRVVQ